MKSYELKTISIIKQNILLRIKAMNGNIKIGTFNFKILKLKKFVIYWLNVFTGAVLTLISVI